MVEVNCILPEGPCTVPVWPPTQASPLPGVVAGARKARGQCELLSSSQWTHWDCRHGNYILQGPDPQWSLSRPVLCSLHHTHKRSQWPMGSSQADPRWTGSRPHRPGRFPILLSCLLVLCPQGDPTITTLFQARIKMGRTMAGAGWIPASWLQGPACGHRAALGC